MCLEEVVVVMLVAEAVAEDTVEAVGVVDRVKEALVLDTVEAESSLVQDMVEAEFLDMVEAAVVVDTVDTPVAVDNGSEGVSCGLRFGCGRRC